MNISGQIWSASWRCCAAPRGQ